MDVEIRPLATQAEYRACVALQGEIWGAGFADRVAPSVLQVSQKVGGVASGAFRGDELVGFVFGLTGIRLGEIVHWSDMLAVRADARGAGVATRLKAHQRDRVRALGVTTMYWTFDPLVARNAHFNFNTLGATLDEYVPDMYGTTGSDLHGGLETDRLIVAWRLDGRVPPPPPAADDGATRIHVPPDFESVLRDDAGEATRWRREVRLAFDDALRRGLTVRRFHFDRERGDGYYVMEQ